MVQVQVRALFDFQGESPDELSFRKGDILAVAGEQGGWYTGQKDGRVGIFPANYVEKIGAGAIPVIAPSSPTSPGAGSASSAGAGPASSASPFYDPAQPRPADDPRRTRLSIPLPLEAALTYSLGTVTGVLFLMLEKENDYVRFHAWQSCFLFLPLLLLHAILAFTLVGSIIILVIDILVIIAMAYKAHKDAATLDRFMLPLIGPLADRMNREENEL